MKAELILINMDFSHVLSICHLGSVLALLNSRLSTDLGSLAATLSEAVCICTTC